MAAVLTPAEAGYQVVHGVLAREETSELYRAIDASATSRTRAGARHLMSHSAVREVAYDRRLFSLAVSFLGPSAVPYRATLFDKSPGRNWLVPWHQDTALPLERRIDVFGWGPWSVKAGIAYAHAPARALSRVVALRLHFDDSCSDNGPLRVIPATHLAGVLSDAEVGAIADAGSPVDCLTGAGGVIAMRPLIVHASSKAVTSRPRRVLHIEYAASLDAGDGLRIAIA